MGIPMKGNSKGVQKAMTIGKNGGSGPKIQPAAQKKDGLTFTAKGSGTKGMGNRF